LAGDDGRDVPSTHLDLVVAEVLAGVRQLQEDGIGHSLAGERGTRGPERDRGLVLRGDGQDALHLVFAVNLYHHLGQQAVERRVGAVRERLDRVGVHPLHRDDRGGILLERGVPAVIDPAAVHVAVHGHAPVGDGIDSATVRGG
jgi:hypothetical protein